MGFILAPLIFGLICFFMAENRNRNPLLGFLSGFIFGIFAIFYYMMAGDNE